MSKHKKQDGKYNNRSPSEVLVLTPVMTAGASDNKKYQLQLQIRPTRLVRRFESPPDQEMKPGYYKKQEHKQNDQQL